MHAYLNILIEFSSISEQDKHSGMEENLVLLCAQVNRLDRNVDKDIEVPVLKSVHRSSSTNQSCVQRSPNPCYHCRGICVR